MWGICPHWELQAIVISFMGQSLGGEVLVLPHLSNPACSQCWLQARELHLPDPVLVAF